MNAKQSRFVAEYLIDSNATQAAIRAGYSKNGAKVAGHRLLTNINVSEAIRKGRERLETKLEQKAIVTREWAVEKLIAIHDAAMGENPVVDRYGNPTGTTTKNFAGANKAVELLCRMNGWLADVSLTAPAESWDEIVKGVYGRKSGAKDGDNRPLH